MILEQIYLLLIVIASFIVILDLVLTPRLDSKFLRITRNLLPVLIVIFSIREFAFEAYRIPSGSMHPTLMEGDVVVVDKYSYGLRVPILGTRLSSGQPQRGDIVVFRGEHNGETIGMIKRVVAVPGEHLFDPENNLNLVIPENSYFVMGDDRDNSIDSRDWGVLSDQQLVGKARFIALSFDFDNPTFTDKLRWQRFLNSI